MPDHSEAESASKVGCISPQKGYRGDNGAIFLSTSAGGHYGRLTQFDCGWCIGCRLKKSRDWSIRLQHESRMHERNSFLTLTYNDEKLPTDLSLNVTHWQLFAKRLRKSISKNKPPHNKFRFYHCGEYGEQTLRPHYHAIMFGLDFVDSRKPHKKSGEHTLYTSERLTEIWGKGHVYIGDCTPQSCDYVSKYVTKKIVGDERRTLQRAEARIRNDVSPTRNRVHIPR